MQRSKLFELMEELYGMKAAFDEIMATAIKRQHEPQRIIGDLLAPRSARSRRALSTNACAPVRANRWAAIRARHS
jgi:hypothetical protein